MSYRVDQEIHQSHPSFFFEMDAITRPLKKLRRLSACNHRDWPGLPDDILLRIIDRVKVPEDYVRFGAVCRPWRSVFLEHKSKNPSRRPLPFLLVAPEEDSERRHMALYSLSTRRLSGFRLRLPRSKVCRGSSFGWLVTLRTKAPHNYRIQLHNPFLRRTLDLPPVDTLLLRHPDDPWDGYYLHKAVLCSDPSSSGSQFVVMAIMSRYSGLAFYRAGDLTWTSIGDWHMHWAQGDAFYDVAFLRGTNRFCAVLNTGAVFAVDLEGDPKLTQIAPPIVGHIRFRSYLVEDSSGDLLQVFKNFEQHHPPGKLTWSQLNGGFKNSSFTSTVKFTVFKLGSADGEWIKIDEIGDNVMFLGNNASMLLPASDCPGCEPGCIYYTDDDGITYRFSFTSYGPPADGVYSLKDGVAGQHYSSARSGMIRPRQRSSSSSSKNILPQAIWLQPTLRGATI